MPAPKNQRLRKTVSFFEGKLLVIDLHQKHVIFAPNYPKNLLIQIGGFFVCLCLMHAAQ